MFIQAQEKLVPDFHENLKVILLGTGTPRSFVGRSKSGAIVLAGNKTFLVDCGAGVVDRMIQAGVMPQRISDVLFTHHHSDHNSGFFDVFISSWRTHVNAERVFEGRKVPMSVYGPTTTKEIIGKMRESFDFDVNLRVNYNKSTDVGANIEYFESNEGVVYDRDGIKITAFEVDHRPVKPAIAFKFEYNGKAVVISGDTIPVDNMVKYSQGIDLLIHESYNKPWLDALIEKFPEQTVGLSNPAKYHTTTLEAAEIARAANVKHLVLTHHIPAPQETEEAEAAYIEGMNEIYSGKITMARDLMEFDLG
ncbi:MBL fold metallo-hydrolase [Paenibacillus radicis (ex Xue et al. 2023)]|uniref:MBL fold metallo-hydrolase n=1 Tax=Paenibacillus radicis (ex Xue et al. 2023) TaxID=2972489 RepID=A0ABT1YN09_9BACL|nr:MBL fold metallo-hydrolase [Paenibacillus radicis (ex Xue et al. 2023)]MCR8634546.1 MBL fold metallo-hydrolase [Paenibacillus radicis (ex Xue et al. 2023)]